MSYMDPRGPGHLGYPGSGFGYPQHFTNSTPRGGNNDRSRLADETHYWCAPLEQPPLSGQPEQLYAPSRLRYDHPAALLSPNEPSHAASYSQVDRSNFDLKQVQLISSSLHESPVFLTGPGRIYDADQPVPLHQNWGRNVQVPKAHTIAAGPVSPELLHAQYPGAPTASPVQDSGFGSIDGSLQSFAEGQSGIFEFQAGQEPALHSSLVQPQRHRPTSVVSEPLLTGVKGPPKRGRKVPPTPCARCGKVSKNQSEARKHQRQHDKTFRCDFSGCKRAIEGFATNNDLERHRKSVHRAIPLVGKSAGYICQACDRPPSGSQRKWWARLDNFKAHVRRKHQECSEAYVVGISETERPEDAVSNAVSESGYSSQHKPCAALEGHDQPEAFHSPMVTPFQVHDAHGDHNAPLHVDTGQFNPLAGIGAGPMGDPIMTDNIPAYQFDDISPMDTTAGMFAMNNTAQQATSPIDSIITSPVNRLGNLPSIEIDEYAFEDRPTPFRGVQWRDPGVEQVMANQPLGQVVSLTRTDSLSAHRTEDGRYACDQCDKICNRECDLRKHIKRHTRRYGCTFPNCDKRFGSRHDWKRHEHGQHRFKKTWRVGLPKVAMHGRSVTRKQASITRLQSRCSLDDRSQEDYAVGSTSASAPDGNISFWCGFCIRLIAEDCSTRSDGQEAYAWDTRIQHIGDHFDQHRDHIDGWICFEHNKSKGELNGRLNATSQLELEEDDSDLGDDGIQYPVGAIGEVPPSCGSFDCGQGTARVGVNMSSDNVEIDGDADADGDSNPGY